MTTFVRLSSAQPVPGLSASQRASLARLADTLIPGDGKMAAASEVGVHRDLIDRALAARPDLWPALEAAVAAVPVEDVSAEELLCQIDAFADERPTEFAAFGQLLKGAYFLDDSVREAIGYPGQEARALHDDTDSYVEMLAEVVERGEIFRPTPTEP